MSRLFSESSGTQSGSCRIAEILSAPGRMQLQRAPDNGSNNQSGFFLNIGLETKASSI